MKYVFSSVVPVRIHFTKNLISDVRGYNVENSPEAPMGQHYLDILAITHA